MLTGGFAGYPDGVVVAEEVLLEPTSGGQGLLSGRPRMYASAGGQLLGELPFDPTAVELGTDGQAMIEEAMQAWVAFRHMTRV